MRHLDQLKRKCFQHPKMGGNKETIILPCSLVSRLITLAEAWESIPPELDRLPLSQEMQGLLVDTEDMAAFLFHPKVEEFWKDQRTPAPEAEDNAYWSGDRIHNCEVCKTPLHLPGICRDCLPNVKDHRTCDVFIFAGWRRSNK